MRPHLLKHMVPAALLSAVVVVLTLGVSAAQAAVIHGRGVLPLSHGGTSVGLVIVSIAIPAIVIGGIVYIVVAYRRQPTPAVSVGEPARLLGDMIAPEQERKAA
jgi:hypothetical protein